MPDDEPFREIQPHREVLAEVEHVQDQLDEIEQLVKQLEWLTLGGDGTVDPDEIDRLTESVEEAMPALNAELHDLHDRAERDAALDNLTVETDDIE